MPSMPALRSSAILCALFCFFAGITIVWLRLDKLPPAWDDAWYLTNSLVLYDAWTDGGVVEFVRQFYTVLGFKAPLITALPLPFYFVFGRNWHVALLVNIVAMGVLFVAIYSAAVTRWNARVGWIAVYVAATMPLLYGLSRWYMVEYSLTALTAVAMALLLAKPGLTNSARPLLFGFICAIGLLLKASFPMFVALPFLLALRSTERRGRTLIIIAIPIVIVALPWYLLHWRATLRNAIEAGFGTSAIQTNGLGAIFSMDAIAGYLLLVARDGVSFYYSALFAAGIIFLLWQRHAWIQLKELLPWFAPFAVFLLAGNKDIRYAAPLYPPAAICIAAAVDALTAKRNGLLIAMLSFPILSLLATSFHWPYAERVHAYARNYETAEWPLAKILRAVGSATEVRFGERPVLLLATDRAAFNANNFELEARQMRLPLWIATTAYERDREAAMHLVRNATFVVFKDGGEAESPFINIHHRDVVQAVRASDAQEVFTSATLPDGGIARVFRYRKNSLFIDPRIAAVDPFDAQYGERISLSGLSFLHTGNEIEVRYRWRLGKALEREYWCFTHVLDESGKRIGGLDHRLMDGNPVVTSWRPGDEVLEVRRLGIPPDRQGKKLRVKIGLYHVESGERLPVVLRDGPNASIGDNNTAVVIAVP